MALGQLLRLEVFIHCNQVELKNVFVECGYIDSLDVSSKNFHSVLITQHQVSKK